MQLLQWNKELEIGLGNVDTQHKQLIGIINELTIAVEYSQPNSDLLPLVDRLNEYAHIHFKVESDIFAQYEYRRKPRLDNSRIRLVEIRLHRHTDYSL